MKILLIIFTFCLISDGGASKEVTEYSGGDVLFKCKYDTEYTQNPKYFCKGSSPGCSDQIKTEDKNMWVSSGRFSLFDDTKSAEFWVMIKELTVEDTGTYQCGVDISLGKDIYTPVELKVKEDGGASKEVRVYSGGDVLIKCKYNTKYTENIKYFCKGSSPGCSDQIKTGDKNMWVTSGRFSLFDDTKSAEFRVMIRELTVEDTGTYQCGVDISLGKDIYTPVELKVKEDGGASKEVTGYSGGEVLIKCKYDTEYTENIKYFCKGSSPGCSDLIKTGNKNMWVTSGRFSLFDDTKSAEFRVMIRELTVEDTGTYQCGVDKSLENVYTPVELTVNEDLFYEKSISKTVHVGGDLKISCKYPESLRNHAKFLCKGLQPAACVYSESVTENRKDVNVGKFSLYDDRTEQIFTVSIRNVVEQDYGEYWCGAEAAWTSDHGYKVYFTQISLTVTDPRAPVSTSIPTQLSSALPSSSSLSSSSSSSSSSLYEPTPASPPGGFSASTVITVSVIILLIGISIPFLIFQDSICTTASFCSHSDQESRNDKGVPLAVCDYEVEKSDEGLMYTTVIMYSNSTSSNNAISSIKVEDSCEYTSVSYTALCG